MSRLVNTKERTVFQQEYIMNLKFLRENLQQIRQKTQQPNPESENRSELQRPGPPGHFNLYESIWNNDLSTWQMSMLSSFSHPWRWVYDMNPRLDRDYDRYKNLARMLGNGPFTLTIHLESSEAQ
ncbi:hypothetical protein B0H14DRAFT_2594959 [Mycena olivaceomarginata]|nr:hypothetical protein B0H14DRAFT_2594959 [Mycena olivaceomarginata]